MIYKISKPWKEHEKYQLWLAYQLNVPLQVMGEQLNRSVTAINKYLSRSGIRDYNSDFQPSVKITQASELDNIFIACGLDNDTVGYEREFTRQWLPSAYTLTQLERYGIRPPCPWGHKTHTINLPVKSGIGRSRRMRDRIECSMATAINALKRKNYQVKHIKNKNPFQWTYELNNKPMTDAQLLLEINIKRVEDKEPIFLVKGVTLD